MLDLTPLCLVIVMAVIGICVVACILVLTGGSLKVLGKEWIRFEPIVKKEKEDIEDVEEENVSLYADDDDEDEEVKIIRPSQKSIEKSKE